MTRMLRSAFVLSVFALRAPLAQQQPPAVSEAELVRRLASALDSLSKRDDFAGAVLLVKGDRTVFEHAYGFADRERRIPNTVATAFNIGSINKVFTATAIRQLAALGKLDLDGTLAAAWPDYPNQPVARAVTIRQILAMRSGIGGDIFAAPPGRTRQAVRDIGDYLKLVVNDTLHFTPGTREEYSNAGYIVLGALIEHITGASYYDYVRTHVYAPASMVGTAHYTSDSLPAGVAHGYTHMTDAGRDDGPLRPNLTTLPGRGSSAGGGYSIMHDLARYVAALRAGAVPSGGGAGIGVLGGAPGLNAALEGGLPGGYDLVVMANLDPPAAGSVGRLVRGWLGARD